jgi:hypothetical protein
MILEKNINMYSSKTSTIGLVELPQFGLINSDGQNLIFEDRKRGVLISKQVLLSSLQAEGFDAQLVNLKSGDYQEEYGKVSWRGAKLSKVYLGEKIDALDSLAYDAWGITNNFSQQREIACLTIKHLASKGRPVVVGGSDVIAEPELYLRAGASAIVLDKSGAANGPIMRYVLGKTSREELSGVILAEGPQPPLRSRRTLSPQDWTLPELSVVKQCLGTQYKGVPFPEGESLIGSIFTDIGCDRKCDFCQTPDYRLGYWAMSPKRVLQWAELQQEAGAWAIMLTSDQFLARIVKKGGREDILEIMKELREMGLSFFWNNGIELKKMTLGRGINRKQNLDFRPDEELISALWNWDGKVGCYFAYIPAERPIAGRENYKKLLPWQEHCDIMKMIVRAGVPHLRYGVIIGFADDSNETLLRLEEALCTLYEDLITINPSLKFQITPVSISPIPGTPQGIKLRQSGLLRFDDPSIFGSAWTTSVDTHYLSYEQVFDWQKRLTQIGNPYMKHGMNYTD